jgi:predicted amidohydrolase YtcJ
MAARLTTFVVVAIVAVTLIAGLIVGAQRDDNDGPVDLIVHNARVYTATARGTMAEAVAIRGNQILRVGSEREITRLQRPQTTMIDAGGAAVIPGFNDTDVDFLAGGATLDRLDLTDAATTEDVARRIQDWAGANPDRAWVAGRGWLREAFTDGSPTRQMLDRLVPDRPARMLSADGRTAWVNSQALRLAKLERRHASAAGSGVGRDPRTGEPTGLLHGPAAALVERLVPAPTLAQRTQAIQSATAEAHRHGITSVQDVAGADELASYAEARRTGDLRVRVYSALPVHGDLTDEEIDSLEQTAARYPDDPLLKAGALHFTLDERAGAASAATDVTPAAGPLHYQPDVFNRLVRRLDARGWQIITDASRVLAVSVALNAYEHAARSNPHRTRERRHRLQNLEAAARHDLARLANLGVIASMRPWIERPVGDSSGNGDAATDVRPETIARGRVAFGSGWPAASFDPILGMSAVVGSPAAGGERTIPGMPLQAAIEAYTARAAWASFDEQRKGTIAPGMLADIVVLSDDIFRMAPGALPDARVDVTIFDGKVVYRRDGHATTN